ncbi:uncharacterized protein LOC124285699 [Haliotis rubra]|uniref:uncharacterized protein LOC124285699 n=1 Tax=Haliotis rubra TaxID=36100 RepID=UPI001EE58326|nr:uncharacterized protein LOC124285699 [Haliotis rubra]
MGINIDVWRARIGCFTQPKGTKRELIHGIKLCGGLLSRQLHILLIAALLLLLSGNVERNPGPRTTRQSQLAVSASGVRHTGVQGNSDHGDILRGIEEQLKSLNTRFTNFETSLQTIRDEQSDMWREMDKLTDANAAQSQKVEQLESQSRRENLLFFGIPDDGGKENSNDSEEKVRDFLKTKLEVESSRADCIPIERAHRLPTKRHPRPIIVKFSAFKDREYVSKIAKEKLSGNREVRVSPDFTQAVRNTRRQLGKLLQTYREKGEDCYISYDKLVVNNTVYTYDWDKDSLREVGRRRIPPASRASPTPSRARDRSGTRRESPGQYSRRRDSLDNSQHS